MMSPDPRQAVKRGGEFHLTTLSDEALAHTGLPAALGCHDEIQSPTEPAFWQVSGGQDHTCGVTTDWLAYCWGDNFTGRLGVGTNGDDGRLTPTAVVGGLRFKQVSAGASFTCGVTIQDLAYCWGDNTVGQLGNGTRTGPERCDANQPPEGIPCSTRPVAVTGGQAGSRSSR